MKKLLTHFLPITLLIFVTCSIANAQKAKLADTTSEVYKKASGANLKIYRFDPEGHDPKKEKRPAVVFFFGGGWNGGSIDQFALQSRYLAGRGMVAFVADYRVKSRHKVAPNACVEDGKSAVRWVRKNADRLGIDPELIAAGGGSAGGHVAAAAGICEGFENESEDLSISSKPNALLLFNPVYDNGAEDGFSHDRIKEWFPAISPAHNITADDPPTIVFLGSKDKLIPVAIAESFRNKMNQQKIQTELHVYDGQPHGFFNPTRGIGFSDTLAKTDQFLVKLGYLSGPVDAQKIKALEDNAAKAKKDSEKAKKQAELNVASPFSDNAVLQRDIPVPVWGTAKPGTAVKVEFAGQKKSSTADDKGRWKIQLEPMAANASPQKLSVSSAKSKVAFSNVLVGEVWICAGQSNMQMSYKAVPEIKALMPSAENIRWFSVPKTVAFTKQDQCEGQWLDQPPDSAVAFAFAHFLEEAADVPIGIFQASWGSSSIEGWMPKDLTQKLPHFKKQMKAFDADTKKLTRIKELLAGPKPWNRKNDIFLRTQPNIIYNAMIHPLAPYACRGLVWYQGEANAKSIDAMLQYDDSLNAWIQRYRQQWGQDDFHFLGVMLPGYAHKVKEGPKHPGARSWAWIRESQLKALELQQTAIANTVDLGQANNIHPKDKLPIGKRLALLAARDTLGQDVQAQGPVMNRVEVKGAQLVVHFDHAKELKTLNGNAPAGFWLADDSKKWVKAKTKLSGKTVTLSSPELKKPLYVRYAFAGKPEVNLVNGADLPAYPFRTDTFKP